MIGIALAAGLFAQAASGQASTPTPQKLTVTGCVERADQVTPTGSTLGTTVDSMDFVLMKAKEGPNGTAPAATSGSTAAESAAPPAGPLYRLNGAVGTLNPHVGHKVEITGEVADRGPTSAAAAQSGANAPMLKVDSIKMIAPTCAR
jgi:hypothetical protein